MIVSDYRWGQAKRNALARLSLAQRFAIEKGKAESTLARLCKHGDDYIQDPATGLMQGSRPHGEKPTPLTAIEDVHDAPAERIATIRATDYYHGSARTKEEFDRLSNAETAVTYFTSSKEEADEFARMDSGIEGGTPTVYKVKLQIKNPAVMDDEREMQDLHLLEKRERLAQLMAAGYDAAIGPESNAEIGVFAGAFKIIETSSPAEDDDIAAEARAFRAQAERILLLVGRHADVDYVQDPETGRFQGSRPHGHGDEAVSDTPETDKLLKNEKDITDVTGFEDEGFVGFLTPDGRALNTSDSHSASAKNAGTILWKVMEEGTARIYAASEFLGIDIEHKPTKDQIKELQTIARKGAFERFVIEGRMDVFEGQVTPAVVREQIERAFATVHLSSGEIGQPSNVQPFTPDLNVFQSQGLTVPVESLYPGTWMQAGEIGEIKQHATEVVVKLGGAQIEYLAMVGATKDPAQGTRVGITKGDQHSCNIPVSFYNAMDENKEARFHFFHNHPMPYPLSIGDIGFLNATMQAASIREDDTEGGWSSARIVGRKETDTTTGVNWSSDFPRKVEEYGQEVRRLTGNLPHQPIAAVKLALEQRRKEQQPGAEDWVAADDPAHVPAFLQQHAMMLGLHDAKFIEYEFHPAPWHERWLKEYSKELAETVEIAKERAAKIAVRQEKWVLSKGKWYPA